MRGANGSIPEKTVRETAGKSCRTDAIEETQPSRAVPSQGFPGSGTVLNAVCAPRRSKTLCCHLKPRVSTQGLQSIRLNEVAGGVERLSGG